MMPMEQDAGEPIPPLTPAVFGILMALADGEKHGYAIMQSVAADSGGALKMGPGTLYGTLERMLRGRLIEETEKPDDSAPHSERRRFYRATGSGERALRAEVRRLEGAVALARRKRLTLRRSTSLP